jgi:hypothetical protein
MSQPNPVDAIDSELYDEEALQVLLQIFNKVFPQAIVTKN